MPYLVILEVWLQRDPGQSGGWDQVWGGILGLGLQGPQEGKAQPQETEGHGFGAEATGQLLGQAGGGGGRASAEAGLGGLFMVPVLQLSPGWGAVSFAKCRKGEVTAGNSGGTFGKIPAPFPVVRIVQAGGAGRPGGAGGTSP